MSESSARDDLARQRTHLANERTLLAYVRTALMTAASGVTLVKLCPEIVGIFWIGSSLGAASIGILAIGAVRFFMRRRDLSRAA